MPQANINPIKLYQRTGTPYWWFDFFVGATRIRRSTGTTSRRVAARIAREAYDAARRGAEELERVSPAVNNGDDLAMLAGLDVAEAVGRGVGEKQRESVLNCWAHLCRLLGADLAPHKLDHDKVLFYVAQRRQEKARGQSIRKEIQALKRGLKIARRRGSVKEMLADWPTVRSDPPRKAQAGKLHPPEVIGAWLSQLKELHPRAWQQAQVAVGTGLRATELRRIEWSWVEDAPPGLGVGALLRVPAEAAKTRTERVVGLTPTTLDALRAALSDTDAAWEGRLMESQHRRAFKAAATAVGYPRTITLRDLRHCYATWAAQGTGDAAAAQAALGHSELRVTQRYLTATLDRVAQASLAAEARVAGTVPHGLAQRPDTVTHTGPRTNETRQTKEAAGSSFSGGRGDRIRTCDPLLPKQVRYQAALLPDRAAV